jgi:hypothetical protein
VQQDEGVTSYTEPLEKNIRTSTMSRVEFQFSTRQAQITFETSCAACPGVIVALSALRR